MVTAQNDISHRKVIRNTTKFKKLPPGMPQLKSKITMKAVDSDSDEDFFDLQHGRTSEDTNQEGAFQEDLPGGDAISYEGTSSDKETDVDDDYSVQHRI